MTSCRERESADFGWRFHRPSEESAATHLPPSSPGFDDKDWSQVDLPHDWSIGLPRTPTAPSASQGGFFQTGMGWYRRSFVAPERWREKTVTLVFDGVYMNSTVWLNGVETGRHAYGYTGFQFDISKHLEVGGDNVLAVRVDNSAQTNSRWYSGSGIYRHVFFDIANPVHISPLGGVTIRTPVAERDHSQVLADVTVANETAEPCEALVKATVIDPSGRTAAFGAAEVALQPGISGTATVFLQVAGPQRWAPGTPHLYRLITDVVVAGKTVDQVQTRFGIRKVEFDPEKGLLLNDQPIKLRGGCIHHDNGPLGAAAFDAAEERKVRIHKELGYNAFRMAHNPPSTAMLEACDKLGMLVIDELFDEWKWEKAPYNKHGYHEQFDRCWEDDVATTIQRDRNHPSVILWSIGNEITGQASVEGGEVARKLAACVKEFDRTRPVTQGLCSWNHSGPIADSGPVIENLDVIGCNYLAPRYTQLHKEYPAKLIFGAESLAMMSWYHWEHFKDTPWVIGDFVWPSMDYFGECREFPQNLYGCGDLDSCGLRTAQSWYRRTVWGVEGDELGLFAGADIPLNVNQGWRWWNVLASWNWPGMDDKPITVHVYSRHPRVELFLDGKSLGSGMPVCFSNQALSFDHTGSEWRQGKAGDIPGSDGTMPMVHAFTVRYQPGELKAVARNDSGKAVATALLKTAGKPARLRLVPEKNALTADGQDLLYVRVEVTDDGSNLNPTATPLIRLKVSGAATILGMGNGDPQSTELYAGTSEHTACHGRLLVILRSTQSAGPVTLEAAADGLTGGVLKAESTLASEGHGHR